MLLYILLAAPFAAALLAAFAAGKDSDANFRLGLVLSAVIAALGLPLVTPGLVAPSAIAPTSVAWFTLWGTGAQVHLSLASDGLSGWLIQLVTWLTPVAILGSRRQIGSRMREFVVCVLAMEALMIGALLARDLVVFYLCYEGMLIPMVVIIALFGGIERRSAALWFFLYTMLASIFMLVAIWYLAWRMHSTELRDIVDGFAFAFADSPKAQNLLFWAFVLAFAVKVPLPPLHGWQPRTYSETPGAGVVLLAGAMAKLGVYGFLRFVLPIFPIGCAQHAHLFIILGAIATVGGALVAIAQDDAKRMLAYSSLSHLGLVMVGIFTFTPLALNGAAVQMVAHGFSVAGLFLLVGYLESRAQAVGIDDFGGLAEKTPVLAVLFVLAALASAGLPGTANFIGEFELLFGTYRGAGFWTAAIVGIPVILVVVYILILVQRWFYGAPRNHSGQEPGSLTDVTPAEGIAVALVLAASYFFGFYPAPISSQAGEVAEKLGAPAASEAAMLAAPKPETQAVAVAAPTQVP
jgi:NADH-quinone oxidoreductase subunit M